MSAPYVVEQQVGEITWYVVSAEYATAYMARQTWERIERRLKTGTVGMYRHGPEDDPGRWITAVGLNPEEIQRVANALRVGVQNDLPERERLSMIARRARVVTDAAARGQKYGRLKWRRPEQRGAELTAEGEMIEPPPGQG